MLQDQDFKRAWRKYVSARDRCRQLDGSGLLRAQDQEAEAFFALVKIRSRCIAELGLKAEALEDVLSCIAGWGDGRETLMLQSIRKDLHEIGDR